MSRINSLARQRMHTASDAVVGGLAGGADGQYLAFGNGAMGWVGGAYNVERWGLAGDDSTDNTAAFSALLADIAAEDHVTLFFPRGIYQMEQVQPSGFETFRIVGPNATFKQKAGSGALIDGGILEITDCGIVEILVHVIDGNNLNGGGVARDAKAAVHITSRNGGTRWVYSGPHEQKNINSHGVLVRSESSETGPDRIVFDRPMTKQIGGNTLVYAYGGGNKVHIISPHAEDPAHLCAAHQINVIGSGTAVVDMFQDVVVTDGFTRYARQDQLFFDGCRKVRVRGWFSRQHNIDSLGNDSPVGTPMLKTDYVDFDDDNSIIIEGWVSRDTNVMDANTHAIELAEGTRHSLITDFDVDADLILGSSAGAGDPGHTNRVHKGYLRREAEIRSTDNCEISDIWMMGPEGAVSFGGSPFISIGDGTVLRNIRLRNYSRLQISSSMAAEAILENIDMDSTCEIYSVKPVGNEQYVRMKGVHGGALNLAVAGGVDAHMHWIMDDCWFDSIVNESNFRANADLIIRDCWIWDATNHAWKRWLEKETRHYLRTISTATPDLRDSDSWKTDGSGLTITSMTAQDDQEYFIIVASADTIGAGVFGSAIPGPAAVRCCKVGGTWVRI